jgi:hypothetical protein
VSLLEIYSSSASGGLRFPRNSCPLFGRDLRFWNYF